MAEERTKQIRQLKEQLQNRFGPFPDYTEEFQPAAADSIASMIDHTLLKPEATKDEIKHLCEEAIQYNFKSVCVNPVYVPYAYSLLKDQTPLVCTVIGFPFGATTTDTKVFEAKQAVANGAAEVDTVISIGLLKAQNQQAVFDDIKAVVDAVRGKALVKVIIEAALLTDEEKIVACLLAQLAGADFVKTSTGFSKGGASEADIRLMRETVGPTMGVKASGGVRTREQALAMVAAGATRIGASASVAIVTDSRQTAAKTQY